MIVLCVLHFHVRFFTCVFFCLFFLEWRRLIWWEAEQHGGQTHCATSGVQPCNYFPGGSSLYSYTSCWLERRSYSIDQAQCCFLCHATDHNSTTWTAIFLSFHLVLLNLQRSVDLAVIPERYILLFFGKLWHFVCFQTELRSLSLESLIFTLLIPFGDYLIIHLKLFYRDQNLLKGCSVLLSKTSKLIFFTLPSVWSSCLFSSLISAVIICKLLGV